MGVVDNALAGCLLPHSIMKVANSQEAAGVWGSFAYVPGMPGAMVAPSPGLNGTTLTTYAGQLPFSNPTGGKHKKLYRFEYLSNQTGSIMLVDRLWHNSGFTITQAAVHTIASFSGLPARDRDGTTDGVDVMVGLEASVATTNGSPVTNTTMSYTNAAGTSGRTATMTAWPATAVAGTFVPFLLQAGDTGVRSIQSITLGTSYGAGTIHAVMYRKIAQMGIKLANIAEDRSFLELGMPRCYDDTVPFLLWMASSVSSPTTSGGVTWTEYVP